MRKALTLSLFSLRYVMSGITRSIPNISSSGNISPQSMTTMSSPYSNTYMFLPISPTPPRGMIRREWLGVAIRGECFPSRWSEDGHLGRRIGDAGPAAEIGGEHRCRERFARGLAVGGPGPDGAASGAGIEESARRTRDVVERLALDLGGPERR